LVSKAQETQERAKGLEKDLKRKVEGPSFCMTLNTEKEPKT